MPRPKLFSREEILSKSLELFWKKGFADTSIQDIEKVTGVNKSGLYSEFKSKDEIYSEVLKRYLELGYKDLPLLSEPKGFKNIESFLLKEGSRDCANKKGCFAINAVREVSVTPKECEKTLENHLVTIKSLLIENLLPEGLSMPQAEQVADIIITFNSGICIEQNLGSASNARVHHDKVNLFLKMIRSLISVGGLDLL